MKFVAAKCPSCSGELQVPEDKDFVKCMYCGADIKVREAIKITLDANIPNLMELANDSLKSGNNEEAYNYYNKILEFDIKNYEAWFGKAVSASKLSTLANPRHQEMLNYFDNAVKYYDKDDIQNYKILICEKIQEFCIAFFNVAKEHKDNYITVDSTWPEYITLSYNLISVLKYALSNYNSKNINVLKCIIHISKNNIGGSTYMEQVMIGNSYRTVQRKKTISEKHRIDLQKQIQNAKDIWKKMIQDDIDNIRKADPKNWENYDNWVKESKKVKKINQRAKYFISIGSIFGFFIFLIIGVSLKNNNSSVSNVLVVSSFLFLLAGIFLYIYKYKKTLPPIQEEFKEFRDLYQKEFKEFNQF